MDLDKRALDRWIERSDEDWDGGWRDPSDWSGAEWVAIRGDTVTLITPVIGFLQMVFRDVVEGRWF